MKIVCPDAQENFKRVMNIMASHDLYRRTDVLNKTRDIKLLGVGGSRSTYALSSRLAIKLAHCHSGVVQNNHEIKHSKHWNGDHIAKVVAADKFDRWMVMERAFVCNHQEPNDFRQRASKIIQKNFGVVGANTDDLYYAIHHVLFDHKNNNKACQCKLCARNSLKIVEASVDNEWFNTLLTNVQSIRKRSKNGTCLDLHSGNWGVIEKNGKDQLVIVDYGYVGR